MLLCIMIPTEIANNPGHLLQSGSVAADPPAFMGNRGCEPVEGHPDCRVPPQLCIHPQSRFFVFDLFTTATRPAGRE